MFCFNCLPKIFYLKTFLDINFIIATEPNLFFNFGPSCQCVYIISWPYHNITSGWIKINLEVESWFFFASVSNLCDQWYHEWDTVRYLLLEIRNSLELYWFSIGISQSKVWFQFMGTRSWIWNRRNFERSSIF